jgi:hypothetical protein
MTDFYSTCPECGAVPPEGLSCRDMLGRILGWEGADLELFNLHFFTVACFNLQHPAQFTDEALAGLKTGFREVADGEKTVFELRKGMGRSFEGSRQVLRPESVRRPVRRGWEYTIADVYDGGRPAGAVQRIRR